MWNLIDLHPRISLHSILLHSAILAIWLFRFHITFITFNGIFFYFSMGVCNKHFTIVCFYRILNAKTFYKKKLFEIEIEIQYIWFSIWLVILEKSVRFWAFMPKRKLKIIFNSCCFFFNLFFSFFFFSVVVFVHWNSVCMHVSSADIQNGQEAMYDREGEGEWCEESTRKTFEQ